MTIVICGECQKEIHRLPGPDREVVSLCCDCERELERERAVPAQNRRRREVAGRV
jgi:hypothetical protein